MNTRQMQNVNQKVILKRIEILTMLEFTINWILCIMQEYWMHSWFFLIIVQQCIIYHRYLFISFQTYLKFTSWGTLNTQFPSLSSYCNYPFQTHRCMSFLLTLLIITIIVYGIQFKLILLFFQIPIVFLKTRLRSLALTGHSDRQQHIQLDTSRVQ
ncbi:unnamed protein product (macronuclear) [Paramecium tetraurelia]|uniref:Transmembrane protein n=1 Tax=Paramecium tetraurelia TaxID=5888 RepID=A0BSG7_PARTE|nr:uncharacterized protein GSPATT00031716001 [Paramecium tetraurelia]CAK61484.1 unnamed protein product [Paramecium tetraurelia]|eukprot:XP_001428882.1 hypothetical protein (macronuclear) [Paramecium tetraurelia strain d4-2]